ncbi:MAG: hypothetical protein KBS35_00935 [Mycoplasma sp.]|nr:hypothetical protein [Candidatus Hennigella equi]
MFEYSLDNGKAQLKGGLICFIWTAVLTVVWLLLMLIPNATAQIILTVLFAIPICILGILFIIKTIFGAIVYHAERTSQRSSFAIQAEREREFKAIVKAADERIRREEFEREKERERVLAEIKAEKDQMKKRKIIKQEKKSL